MCLAIPMRLVEKRGTASPLSPAAGDSAEGVVELEGVRRTVSLLLLPEARIGDHLLVHAGYAIGRVDPDEAARTLELLRELGESREAP